MGELYPVENFQVTINEVNQADEISFTYYKETDGETRPLFEQIDDLTVVQVQDYGFFELAVNKQQSNSVKKSVSGISLGVAELSQITESLEINTDDDTDREDYDVNYPTVFYREITIDDSEVVIKKKTESSLLHRILKRAPHYKIGYVSPTLKYVQRTFSWSDADIVSIFNDISEEINCVFDVHVDINEDGEVERIVNVYDMRYCEYCWNQLTTEQKNTNNVHQFRNIVNGVCQNCGQSDYIRDIGDDTNIFISVDNLSDEITVDSDKDSIKNCFKISGGDDFITDTVKGLSMSGSDRIFMFSDYQKKLMSTELVEAYEKYVAECNKNKDAYTKLLETQYNLYDVIAYLQSGKMPLLEEEITSLDMALYKTIEQIQTYYEGKCYVTQWSYYNTSMMTAYNAVKNLFTTFLPKGYHMTIEEDDKVTTDEYDPKTIYKWMGKIRFYRTINSDDYYILHLEKSSTYITHGKDTNNHYHFEDTKKQTLVNNFKLSFYFGDKSQTEYMGYIKQHAAYLLSQVDLTYDNEKARHWEDYGLNPLSSYYDGFTSCIEAIDMVISEEEFEDLAIQKLKEIKFTYQKIQSDINRQIGKLEQQIFALCYYLGDFSMAQSYVDSTGAINSAYQKYISSIPTILSHMVDIKYKGGYEKDSDGNVSVDNNYIVNEYIGDKPIKCKQCGSTNVSLTTNSSVCNNCNGTDIYTYADMMQDIVDEYNNTNGQVVTELQGKYRQDFNMESYINKCDTNNLGLYNELCSFIREDVYSNSNFVSDGLTNAEVIAQTRELITKAEQELAKACIQNYTVTAPLSAIVAQKEFEYNGVVVNDDYSGFKINNYVRVKIDDDIFKVRISSIEIPFPVEDKISVTFTNATKSTGTMNAVAEAVKNATSMATSFSSVATQAEKGQQANETFQTIKNEGLNAGLMAVKGGGEEQDVVVDNHGILLRRKIFETGEYSPYQMKLINRNIVMTDDNWNTAKMAIGYGMYEGSPYYGVWCDLLVGNLLCGNQLKIIGGKDETTGNATVVIDGNGITLDGGAIKWNKKLPTSSVEGLDDTVNGFVDAIGDLQSQIDGEITSWFEEYEPTTTNEPASNWITDADKIKHEGDLFYNTDTGAAYRYIYNSSTKQHEWSVITDTAITEALEKASNAQDTADKKRRVFVVEPKPPYDIGDLWTQGSSGDIMKCKVAKTESQSYSESDWEKASKYTDNSALENFISGDYKTALENINTQIDGKADTFYQSTMPHPEYSNVSSNKEYDLYVGDLWYNTSTGKSYMYNKVANGSNFDYTWKFMNVPQDVYDKIDGVASIYVTLPSNPNVGDLLIPNSDISGTNYKEGKVYKYNGSTWNEIKYTDDSAWKSWTSDTGEFGKYKTEIKKQIDSKSNCTYGGSTPPSNPETGDLWFCTDGSGGYGANKAYMYNGSVWKESNGVPDSVWDIADGKSSIFVVKPNKALSSVDSNFYHKNDIWILESDMTLNGKDYKAGSIMTATSDSTEFDQTHWVEKVRYTDDTKANSVETAINIFQTNVNNLLNADISTTVIGEDYVFAPKIGGGYLYIKNASDKRSVTIDPQQTYSSGGDIFKITDKYGNITIGADSNGNAIFNGKVTASSGNIGGWDIGTGENLGWLINYGTTSAYGDCGIYWENTDYYAILNQSNWEMGTNDACLFRLNVNNPNYIGHGSDDSNDNRLYCNLGYINMTSKGYIDINSSNSINFNSSNSINFNNLTKFYKGIRIQASLSDYVELGVTALDSSATNAYFTSNSSAAIGYRLQVGAGISSFYTGYTFYVGGSSYVTGSSYTNSGTMVTSDKNKKNSISTPSDCYVRLFDAINLKRFKYNDGASDRYHLGVIAQELEEDMRSVGISSQDFGGLVIDEQGNYFVRYDEINMLTALKVKQLEERIKVLEDKLNC